MEKTSEGLIVQFLSSEGVLSYLAVCFGIFIITMAFVYVPGRMLEIVKSFKVKNTIATISAICFSYLYLSAYRTDVSSPAVLIFQVSQYSALVIVLYVLIGFNLFDRFDSFLDKRGFEDKDVDQKTKMRKKKQ